MKSDESLQLKVAHQLEQDPLLREAQIVVAPGNDNIVVSGKVNKFFKKAMVCQLVRKTTGVKNITDQISVVVTNLTDFHDEDIEKAIAEKFEKNLGNSSKNITVTVSKGQVLLEGILKWKYQKILATECISYLDGIVSIQNDISTAAQTEPAVSEKDILAAIYKEDMIRSDISVDLVGRKVIVSGNVPTPFQKKLIGKIVREVPGVNEIDNRLLVVKRNGTISS